MAAAPASVVGSVMAISKPASIHRSRRAHIAHVAARHRSVDTIRAPRVCWRQALPSRPDTPSRFARGWRLFRLKTDCANGRDRLPLPRRTPPRNRRRRAFAVGFVRGEDGLVAHIEGAIHSLSRALCAAISAKIGSSSVFVVIGFSSLITRLCACDMIVVSHAVQSHGQHG